MIIISANKFSTGGEIAAGFMKQTLADGAIQTDFLFKESHSRIYQGGA
ncbi:MAG: hypothetical protein MRQ09_04815 [Candidatus Midichloria sp.]|nr:hypothetical protein [Candidatus Midichloria sp.]